MTIEKEIKEIDEPTLAELTVSSSIARSRLAADVRRLSAALEPSNLGHRAVQSAERSAAHAARGALIRVKAVPYIAGAYFRKHPLAGIALGGGVLALVGWRLLARRR
jgi:hypothetical protein